MDWISLGWLRPNGSRYFHIGEGRDKPEIKERPDKDGTIFLADYDGPIEEADTVRLHPEHNGKSGPPPSETLYEALKRHRTAIGYETSALVTAALEGLDVICKGKINIMLEPNWHDLLPYADWHYSEIQSGEAWEHLWSSIK